MTAMLAEKTTSDMSTTSQATQCAGKDGDSPTSDSELKRVSRNSFAFGTVYFKTIRSWQNAQLVNSFSSLHHTCETGFSRYIATKTKNQKHTKVAYDSWLQLPSIAHNINCISEYNVQNQGQCKNARKTNLEATYYKFCREKLH
jgi:hypothetical protein